MPLSAMLVSVVVAAVDDSLFRELQETVRAMSLQIAEQAQHIQKLERIVLSGAGTLPSQNVPPVSSASVSPFGEALADAARRRLTHTAQDLAAGDHSACCRWTPSAQCGNVDAGLLRKCSALHEYLEAKTTTHQFVNLTSCLGDDSSKYAFSFDGHDGNVTLSYDSTPVTSLKTPLQVTHAADCATVPPLLGLQMDTYVHGALEVAGSLVWSGQSVQSQINTAGTVTESTSYDGASAGTEAFDDDSASRWHTDGATVDQWVKLRLTTPATVFSYYLEARSDDASVSNVDAPHRWRFEGSNDDSNWNVLDTRHAEWHWTTGESRTYYLPPGAPGRYEYYRWFFPNGGVGTGGCGEHYDNSGGAGQCYNKNTGESRQYVVIDEIKLYGLQ